MTSKARNISRFLSNDSTNYLTIDNAENLYSPKKFSSVNITENYQLILSNNAKIIKANSSSSITITVPTNETVGFENGTIINIYRAGTGAVDIAGSFGVVINSTPGLKLRARWSSAVLIKIDTNEWILAGDLIS